MKKALFDILMCSIRQQLSSGLFCGYVLRYAVLRVCSAFSFSAKVRTVKNSLSKYISFVRPFCWRRYIIIRMNASYFLNDPYSLDPQNPRALACVQTPPLLKYIEEERASVHRLPSKTVYQTNLRGPLLVTNLLPNKKLMFAAHAHSST